MDPRKLEHGLRMISAGIPYTLPRGRRIAMFQLSGFHCTPAAPALKTIMVVSLLFDGKDRSDGNLVSVHTVHHPMRNFNKFSSTLHPIF